VLGKYSLEEKNNNLFYEKKGAALSKHHIQTQSDESHQEKSWDQYFFPPNFLRVKGKSHLKYTR